MVGGAAPTVEQAVSLFMDLFVLFRVVRVIRGLAFLPSNESPLSKA